MISVLFMVNNRAKKSLNKRICFLCMLSLNLSLFSCSVIVYYFFEFIPHTKLYCILMPLITVISVLVFMCLFFVNFIRRA